MDTAIAALLITGLTCLIVCALGLILVSVVPGKKAIPIPPAVLVGFAWGAVGATFLSYHASSALVTSGSLRLDVPNSVVVAPLVEEPFKLLGPLVIFRVFRLGRREFLWSAAMSGLGFAWTEMLFQSFFDGLGDSGIFHAAIYAPFGPPLHCGASGAAAIGLADVSFLRPLDRRIAMALTLSFAMGVHAANNSVAAGGSMAGWPIIVAYCFLAWGVLTLSALRLYTLSDEEHGSTKPGAQSSVVQTSGEGEKRLD